MGASSRSPLPCGGRLCGQPGFRGACGGFTLAEILVVIAILGILALCVLRAAGSATSRADVVRCVGNLRGLHVALNTYVIDQNHWPQCPYELGAAGYDEWWIKEMGKYKVVEKQWICPTLDRDNHVAAKDLQPGQSKLDYVPTNFDENPYTPRRWATQPWLIEVADAHGEGNLMAFPDGAIIGATRFLNQHQ